MRKFFFLIAVSLVALSNSYAQENITVGGLFDLTGGGKVWGSTEKNAAELAISEYNERLGGCGKVSLRVEDTAYDTKTALSAYSKLVHIEELPYLIGPTWEVCHVTVPRCERDGVICLLPSCHAGVFSEGTKKSSFTLWFNDAGYGELLGSYLKEHNFKRPVIVSAIGAYYDAVTDGVLSRMPEGIKVFRVLPDAQDFKTLITRIPEDVDGLVILLNSNGPLGSFIQQWKHARNSRPIILSDDEFIPGAARSNVAVDDFSLVIAKPRFNLELTDAFVSKYQKRYGSEPQSPSGMTAYDATTLLLGCLCDATKRRSKEDMLTCITSSTGQRTGLSGPLEFDEAHQIKNREFFVEKIEPKKRVRY